MNKIYTYSSDLLLSDECKLKGLKGSEKVSFKKVNMICRFIPRSIWKLMSHDKSGFFYHLEQNSGRDKTQVLGETQVFLPKTQLFLSQKLRFPKL